MDSNGNLVPVLPKFLLLPAQLPHSLRVEESHAPHQHATPVVANEHRLQDTLAKDKEGRQIWAGFWGEVLRAQGLCSPLGPTLRCSSLTHFLGTFPLITPPKVIIASGLGRPHWVMSS